MPRRKRPERKQFREFKPREARPPEAKQQRRESPYFKAKSASQGKDFSFAFTRRWTYKDKRPCKNPIVEHTDRKPHFILFFGSNPKEGTAAFVLSYEIEHRGLMIDSVQRERTQYTKDKRGNFYWSPALEKKAVDEFKKRTGVHPSELLLSEFIHRYRDEILAGKPVYLRVHGVDSEIGVAPSDWELYTHIYKPLIDRFFSDKFEFVPYGFKGIIECGEMRFPLNLNKKRVRELLGLK